MNHNVFKNIGGADTSAVEGKKNDNRRKMWLVIIPVVFVVVLLIVLCSKPSDPVVGKWKLDITEYSDLNVSSLTVHSNGSFDLTMDGYTYHGKWKTMPISFDSDDTFYEVSFDDLYVRYSEMCVFEDGDHMYIDIDLERARLVKGH